MRCWFLVYIRQIVKLMFKFVFKGCLKILFICDKKCITKRQTFKTLLLCTLRKRCLVLNLKLSMYFISNWTCRHYLWPELFYCEEKKFWPYVVPASSINWFYFVLPCMNTVCITFQSIAFLLCVWPIAYVKRENNGHQKLVFESINSYQCVKGY